MRTLTRAALAACGAAAVSLAFLLPGTIHAEDEAMILRTFIISPGDTELANGIVGAGDIVHDPRAKSGWSVEVTLTNPTDARAPARTTVVVQKSFFNPAGRVSSTPFDVWSAVATADLAPHQTYKRTFAVPAEIGSELDSSNVLAHAKSLAVERARARGEEPPAWADGIEGAARRSFIVVMR